MRNSRRILLIILCLALGGWLGWRLQRPAAAPVPPRQPAPAVPTPAPAASPLALTAGWVTVAPGAAYWIREAGGGQARLAAVRLDPQRYRFEVADLTHGQHQPRTARALAQERGAVAAINGGYFDDKWQPLGALVHAGKQTNPPFRSSGGYFYVREGRPALRATSRGLPEGVTEALQCHPRLVSGGQVVPGLQAGEHLRSAVGVTAAGAVVLAVTCRGELSLHDWARALKALGCHEALNLDGGPSSQLYFRAGEKELDLPGVYAVPSAIVVVGR